jgi:hypothetical protein
MFLIKRAPGQPRSRHKVESWASIAGDDNRFATFNLAREFGQTLPCTVDRYGLHWLLCS